MSKLRVAAAILSVGCLVAGLAGCQSTDSGQKMAAPKECVTKITPAKAASEDGKVVPVESEVLPEITAGKEFGQKPTIAAGQGEPPSQLSRKILIHGNGPEVASDVSVTVHYLGQTWDGHVFDNSYDRGETTTFSLREVVGGWTWGLTGTHVGDRVELVIPPELGYGNNEQPEIPANSTLVFVVDVVYAPTKLGESELAGLVEMLKQSTPVEGAEEKLPEGLKIFCEPGQEPQFGYVEGSPVPSTAVNALTLLEGKGQEIKAGDQVGYVVVGGGWSDTPTSTWTNGDGVSYVMADAGGLVGHKVGDRIISVGPPNTQLPRGLVQVVDLVSSVNPSTFDASGQ